LGIEGSRRTRKSSKWLGIALEEASLAATRVKGSYLQAQYQRLRPRIWHGRALGAVKRSILTTYWHMFTTGETYRELRGDYYQHRDPSAPPYGSSPNSTNSATLSPSNRRCLN
jgi:hypothetical protein